jgi:PAS domain S-box-containing protein
MKQFSEHISKYGLIDLINQTDDKLSLVDRDYIYRAVNQAYVRTFSRPIEEIIGKPVWDIIGRNVFETVARPYLQRALSGEEIRYEAWFDFPDAGRSYLIVRYSPALDENGEVYGVVVTSTDITERKQLEEEKLFYERSMLDQARMAQLGEMITFIAHQWRGPLNTLSSYLLRLRMTPEPSAKTANEEILERCESLIEQLSLSIEDLYTIYRPNGSANTIELRNIIDHAVTLLQYRLDSQHIAVSVEFGGTHAAASYRSEFVQVLVVFIENAVEALTRSNQPHKQITIRVRSEDTATSVDIIDNGEGIDTAVEKTLFEAGVTTKASHEHGYGLFFARKIIAEQMGGSVRLIPGARGGHFHIVIPRQ